MSYDTEHVRNAGDTPRMITGIPTFALAYDLVKAHSEGDVKFGRLRASQICRQELRMISSKRSTRFSISGPTSQLRQRTHRLISMRTRAIFSMSSPTTRPSNEDDAALRERLGRGLEILESDELKHGFRSDSGPQLSQKKRSPASRISVCSD
jgi:hypothetical protein